MADATVFVAIAIGCVIALLLVTAFFVYCIKRHQNKQQNRAVIERQAREERYRRHLMRAQVVRPPPYDAHRQNVLSIRSGPVPFSPPPVYKERATPHPGVDRQEHRVGLGSTPITPAPSYGSDNRQVQIATISRNIAPTNTDYNAQHAYPNDQHHTHNNSIVVREASNNRTNSNSNNRSSNRNNNNNNNESNSRRNNMTNRNNVLNRSDAMQEQANPAYTAASQYIISSSRIPQPPDPPSYSSANRREDSVVGSNSSRAVGEETTSSSSLSTLSDTIDNSNGPNRMQTNRNDGDSRSHTRETPSESYVQSLNLNHPQTSRSAEENRGRVLSSNNSNLPGQRRPSNISPSTDTARRNDTSSATSTALQDLSLI